MFKTPALSITISAYISAETFMRSGATIVLKIGIGCASKRGWVRRYGKPGFVLRIAPSDKSCELHICPFIGTSGRNAGKKGSNLTGLERTPPK